MDISITLNFHEIEKALFELNGSFDMVTQKQIDSGFLQEKTNLLTKIILTELSENLFKKYESIKNVLNDKNNNVDENELNKLINKKWEFKTELINRSELKNINSNNNYPFLWKLKIFEESESL